jgi:hypothetical protein
VASLARVESSLGGREAGATDLYDGEYGEAGERRRRQQQ